MQLPAFIKIFQQINDYITIVRSNLILCTIKDLNISVKLSVLSYQLHSDLQMRTIIIISVFVVVAQALTAQPPANDNSAQKPGARQILQFIADILAKPPQPIQHNETEWSNESWNLDTSTENVSGSAETSEPLAEIDVDEESDTIEESSNASAEDAVEEEGINISKSSFYPDRPENGKLSNQFGVIIKSIIILLSPLDYMDG